MKFRSKHCLPFLLIVLFFSPFSKAQNLAWGKSFVGTDIDSVSDIKLDAQGNVYVAGRFKGVVDFDPGTQIYNMTAAGGYDIYLCKLSINGIFQWALSIGGSGNEYLSNMCFDANGNILLSGAFENVCDFDPGQGTYNHTSQGEEDAFVCKLDPAGAFVWAKKFGGLFRNFAASAVTDSTGNCYVSGYSEGSADFDPGSGQFNLDSGDPNTADNFIVKLTSAGNFVWAKQFGNANDDRLFSMTIDHTNNLFLTGIFAATVDFDPGPGSFNLTSPNLYEIYLLKLDSAGSFMWAGQLGGPSAGMAECRSLAIDPWNNLLATGFYSQVVDFDPGTATANLSASGRDIFVLKLDNAGGFIFAKRVTGPSLFDKGDMICTDPAGNIYVSGAFGDNADFDPGSSTYFINGQVGDAFLLRLSAAGNFQWAGSFGGTNQDFGRAVCVDAGQNAYTAGSYQWNADLDPTSGTFMVTGSGYYDTFICKIPLYSTGIGESGTEPYFSIYPNPSSGTIYLQCNERIEALVIFTTSGEAVFEGSAMNELSLPVSLKSGLYLIRCTTAAGYSFTSKLLLKK